MSLVPFAGASPQAEYQCSASRAPSQQLWSVPPLCPLCAVPEDVRHLFLFCPRAKEIWAIIGLPGLSVSDVESLWDISLPGPNIDNGKVSSTLWNIWKRRNALVFRLEEETCFFTLPRCSADLQLWRHRVQDRRAKLCLDAWSSFLCN